MREGISNEDVDVLEALWGETRGDLLILIVELKPVENCLFLEFYLPRGPTDGVARGNRADDQLRVANLESLCLIKGHQLYLFERVLYVFE